jgi:Spy/CpxP family protein refolding chaperone
MKSATWNPRAGYAFTTCALLARNNEQRKRITMKLRPITFTAVCAALLATASIADAQAPEAKGPHGRGHRGHRGNPLEHMTRNLDLTPEQQAKIQPIIDQAKPQIAAIQQEAKQKAKAVRDNTVAQIRPLLTPEQQQKFDTLQKAREEMRNARKAMREAKQQ